MRNSNPRNALDYPTLADDLFVCWVGNGRKWPDAGRSISFLSRHGRHIMKGFALFTINYADAMTFATEAEARAWVAEQEALRPHPYGVNVTTVAVLKVAAGYEPSPVSFDWSGGNPSHSHCVVSGHGLSVTKWANCWGWEIDTLPSSVLNMDQAGRITSMPGGGFIASGTAPDQLKAKAAAEAAWIALQIKPEAV